MNFLERRSMAATGAADSFGLNWLKIGFFLCLLYTAGGELNLPSFVPTLNKEMLCTFTPCSGSLKTDRMSSSPLLFFKKKATVANDCCFICLTWECGKHCYEFAGSICASRSITLGVTTTAATAGTSASFTILVDDSCTFFSAFSPANVLIQSHMRKQ